MATSPASAVDAAKAFVEKWFLPLGFGFFLIVGFLWPAPGSALNDARAGGFGVATSLAVFVIFTISGLTLKSRDATAALRARKALAWGVSSIVLFSPLLAFIPMEMTWLKKVEFRIGLAVFCAAPTTLSSGVTLVDNAHGNAALALVFTIVTNVLAVVTMPLALSLVLSETEIHIDPVPILTKLLCIVLIPLTAGKTARRNDAVVEFVKKYKWYFGKTSNLCLMSIMWMKVSTAVPSLRGTPVVQILLLALCGPALHFLLLAFNSAALAVLKLPMEEHRAVLIMSSQKTLPMSITVISLLPAVAGAQGAMAIPCLLSHFSQLFIDAFIVAKWNAAADRAEPEAVERLPELAADGSEITLELKEDRAW